MRIVRKRLRWLWKSVDSSDTVLSWLARLGFAKTGVGVVSAAVGFAFAVLDDLPAWAVFLSALGAANLGVWLANGALALRHRQSRPKRDDLLRQIESLWEPVRSTVHDRALDWLADHDQEPPQRKWWWWWVETDPKYDATTVKRAWRPQRRDILLWLKEAQRFRAVPENDMILALHVGRVAELGELNQALVQIQARLRG